MLNRLLNFSGIGILYLAASLFFAQTLLFAYFAFAWKIDRSKINQMIAVAQGYDLYKMEEEKRKELIDKIQQAKYDEVLQIRADRLAKEDMDKTRGGLLQDSIMAQIRSDGDQQKVFNEIVRNWEKRLDDLDKEAKSAGFTELVANMSNLKPEEAKKQVMLMLEKKMEDRVVLIFNAMEEGPRKKLLNAMKTDEEAEKLADILRRIGDGEPKSKIIDEAKEDLSNF